MTNEEAIKWLVGVKERTLADLPKEAIALAIKALETGEVYMTGEDYNLYMEGYKAGKKDFEPKQGEWIPVSERLPEEHGYYLVTTDGSHNAVIDIAEYGKFYRKPENEYVLEWNKASRVIAWQPLPEPYKKGGVK